VQFLLLTKRKRRKFDRIKIKTYICPFLLDIKISSMKKLLLLCSFLGLFTSVNAQLVISEIFYNAPNSGNDSLEFVEFYNKGTAAVNLKGYYFKTAIVDTLPDVSLAAGAFYVVANNAAYFKSKFGKDCRQWSSAVMNNALNNSGELIELRTAAGVLADSVRYSSLAPWPTAPNGGGSSLVLCNLNEDNGNPANWSACTIISTAKISNVPLFVTPLEANCSAGNTVFASPDAVNTQVNKAITIAVLKNDVFTKPVTITATTNPTKGTIVINAKKDSIKYTPNKDFCGSDEFKYTISDGTLTSTANVAVTVSGCTSAGSIKDAKATNADGVLTGLGNIYELSGVVNSINLRPGGLEFPIIDAAGNGIGASHLTKTFGYTVKEGDIVTIKGKLTQFNGYAQITADTIYKTGTGAVYNPKIVTKVDESTESLIVTLKNVTLVDATKWTTGVGTGGFTVEVTDGTIKTQVRINKNVELYNAAAPKGKFNLTGIGYQFDAVAPFTEGYQLTPRYNSDLKLIIATNDLALGENISVFPNPITEELNINVQEVMDNMTITNIVGQVIFAKANISETQKINTSNWQSGIYFVTFVKNERQFTTKLVK
jgi:hypothetical protein